MLFLPWVCCHPPWMTWAQISELLDLHLRRFSQEMSLRQMAAGSGDIPATLEAWEESTGQAVERAIEAFVNGHPWPALTRREEAMLCLRLEFASSLCFLLEGPARGLPVVLPPSLDVPEEQVLRWLLQDAWMFCGWPQILGTARSLFPGSAPATEG